MQEHEPRRSQTKEILLRIESLSLDDGISIHSVGRSPSLPATAGQVMEICFMRAKDHLCCSTFIVYFCAIPRMGAERNEFNTTKMAISFRRKKVIFLSPTPLCDHHYIFSVGRLFMRLKMSSILRFWSCTFEVSKCLSQQRLSIALAAVTFCSKFWVRASC